MSHARLFSTKPNFRQYMENKINRFIAESQENVARQHVAEYYLWNHIKDKKVDEINLLQNVCEHAVHGKNSGLLEDVRRNDSFNQLDVLQKFLQTCLCEYFNVALDEDFVAIANQHAVAAIAASFSLRAKL